MNCKNLFAVLTILFFVTVQPVLSAATEAKLEYNKGLDYYKVGQYDKAMQSFRNAIDLDADYIDAYYNLGSILEYLEQYDAALAIFKQIVVRKPTDYESVLKAANLSKKLGQYDKAKSFLSIIPQGSYFISDAQELANSMNTDMQTIREEQKPINVELPKNNIFENIASPTGITSDKNGNLYVAGYSDNVIYKITSNGDKIIFLKDNRLNGPIGMVIDDLGNIYVANYNANNILKIDSTGFVSILLSGIDKPYGLHIANGILFVSSQGFNSVVKYDIK